MINRLKKKFIALAMASLIALLTVIVAGMNIINYNAVVREADETLEMLSRNKGRLPMFFNDGWDNRLQDIYGEDPSASYDDIEAGTGDYSSKPGGGYGHDGFAPKGFSRDEAEETRFFTVLLDSDDSVITVNTDRIYAVDENQAEEYAAEAVAAGTSNGFIDDYRYCVIDESNYTRITFMDCGRLLDSFRKFLYASIIMSALGLAVVFIIICYFAGRIVRPVAESYEKQKRFITDAGHEIKTPLTIIKANIDLMKMDIDDAAEEESADVNALAGTLNESLDDITGQVDRLTTLTNDLVYLSRMEEGSGSLTMTEVPVSDIVSETAGSFEPVAVERKKTISSEIEPMISMQGSTKELEKLVSILMENALKYSPEGDNIGVTLRKEGKNVVLEVRNKSLTPLSDEDLAHVFERFYRTDKSRNSAAGGHGIGLSMASAITAAHGGKIRARSGDGTEFIVTATMPAN